MKLKMNLVSEKSLMLVNKNEITKTDINQCEYFYTSSKKN